MTSSAVDFACQREGTKRERRGVPRSQGWRGVGSAVGLGLMFLLALPGRGETQRRPVPTQAKPVREATAPKEVGRRDPFKLPPRPVPGHAAPQAPVAKTLPPGRRGLLVGDLKLNGVVREENSQSMIALVTGNNKLTYFLRENDTLYDGRVVRIMPDSIELKQNYLDPDGEVRSREVIKRLTPAGGEGQ